MAPRGRPKKNAAKVEATASPSVQDATPVVNTIQEKSVTQEVTQKFNESVRDQFGGDIAYIESGRDAFGDLKPVSRKRDSILDILPGDYVYKAEPTRKHRLAWHQLNDTEWSRTDYVAMIQNGYQFASPKDFDIRPELRQVVKPSSSDKLTIGGGETNTWALIWCSEERWRENQTRRTYLSDRVSTYAEEAARSAADNNPLADTYLVDVSDSPEYRS